MATKISYIAVFDRINSTVLSLPPKVAILAVNFSKERFVKKNWIDITEEPWKKTKGKRRRGSILVKSGRLKRSIRKISITPSSVTIGTDVPYAQIHNDGGEISGTERVRSFTRKQHRRKAHTRNDKRIKAQNVKAHTIKPFSRNYKRKFERRQFIGQSQELGNRITDLISKELNRVITG